MVRTFENFPQGAIPCGTLAIGLGGNLYGTTYQGGAANLGVVFVKTPTSYKLLHSFKGGTDGANPYSGVTLDAAGNLYGTTRYGGPANAGVVYKLEPSGQETVLYSFTGGSDGANPYAGITLDATGNLYGTTYNGGSANLGVVFKLATSGVETVLHSFTGITGNGTDGANPYAGVILDPSGNLYGTTLGGDGALYEVESTGQEKVLYSFGSANGGPPYAGLVRDSAGNLYGTTLASVYEFTPAGVHTVLHQFPYNGFDVTLESGLTLDAAGNLYGVTTTGGVDGAGVVYKITASGSYRALFGLPAKSTYWTPTNTPVGGVALDAEGNLYGTTPYTALAGIVYKLTQSGEETMLYTFPAAAGRDQPSRGHDQPLGGTLRDDLLWGRGERGDGVQDRRGGKRDGAI